MNLQFHIDPETGDLHIYRHGVRKGLDPTPGRRLVEGEPEALQHHRLSQTCCACAKTSSTDGTCAALNARGRHTWTGRGRPPHLVRQPPPCFRLASRAGRLRLPLPFERPLEEGERRAFVAATAPWLRRLRLNSHELRPGEQ